MRIIIDCGQIEDAAAHLEFARDTINNGYNVCIYTRGDALKVLVRKTKTGVSTKDAQP